MFVIISYSLILCLIVLSIAQEINDDRIMFSIDFQGTSYKNKDETRLYTNHCKLHHTDSYNKQQQLSNYKHQQLQTPADYDSKHDTQHYMSHNIKKE